VIVHNGSGYSIFDSGPQGKLQANWLPPIEEAILHDPITTTSESKMLLFIVAAARWLIKN
jgi:hypothetical protein